MTEDERVTVGLQLTVIVILMLAIATTVVQQHPEWLSGGQDFASRDGSAFERPESVNIPLGF